MTDPNAVHAVSVFLFPSTGKAFLNHREVLCLRQPCASPKSPESSPPPPARG